MSAPQFDAHSEAAIGETPEDPSDLSIELWRAFIYALGAFLRMARKRLGMKEGVKCPRCGHVH